MPYNIYRCQYVHQGPGDNAYSNTWHVATGNAQVVDQSTNGILEGNKIFNPFYEFYNDWAPAGMAPGANNAGTSFKIYNVTVPTGDHDPVYTYTYNVNPYATTGSSLALPSECAVCLSFEAFNVPGASRARRRGRVYLGPLTMDTVANDGYGNAWVSDIFVAAVLDAYKTLVDDLLADGYASGVYSKADGIHLQTASAWVDDAFDTQRRRGQDPSIHTRIERLPDQSAWV